MSDIDSDEELGDSLLYSPPAIGNGNGVSVNGALQTVAGFDEERRAHHNALERKRRDHIKDSFTALKNAVPSLHGEKASRTLILRKACEYIESMRDKIQKHRKDLEEIEAQNRRLEDQVKGVEEANKMLERVGPQASYALPSPSSLSPLSPPPLVLPPDGPSAAKVPRLANQANRAAPAPRPSSHIQPRSIKSSIVRTSERSNGVSDLLAAAVKSDPIKPAPQQRPETSSELVQVQKITVVALPPAVPVSSQLQASPHAPPNTTA